ncbi:MAG: cation diffusion facilitator family transporter [Candidatus Helarchaeota archaeon]|nr:cation diffusion facilitator family transporter [Candidatus Helarchaeota archaeon]
MDVPRKLLFAALITSTIFLAELLGGILFGSLSLIADSFHVILDVATLLFSFSAIKLAARESNEQYTYGYHRLEIFAALVNGILLGIAIFYVVYEAIQRLLNPTSLIPLNVLIIAVIGFGINLISIKLLGHQHEEDVNVKSAYLHVLGDTLSSVAIIIGMIFILFLNIYWIDPLVALIVVVILIRGTYRVLKASIQTLMHKSPIDTNEVMKWMKSQPKVKDVHDLHIWSLCSNVIILTCHVVIDSRELYDACQTREQLEEGLWQTYKIQHSTIQTELQCDKCACDLFHKEHPHEKPSSCPIE